MVKGDDARRAGELLDERDALGVILLLNRRVVVERGVGGRAAEVLESGRVERDRIRLATEVLDLHGVRDSVPVALGAGSAGVDLDVGFGTVRGGREVEERRSDTVYGGDRIR